MEDAYKKINDILVQLVNEIWELEAKAIITDEFKDITNNDMHVIEAILCGKEAEYHHGLFDYSGQSSCQKNVCGAEPQRRGQKSGSGKAYGKGCCGVSAS